MHLGWHTILTCFENREMYLLSGQEIKSKNSLILSRPLAIFKIKDILLKVQKHTQKNGWYCSCFSEGNRNSTYKNYLFLHYSGFPSVSEASKIPCCLSRDESGKWIRPCCSFDLFQLLWIRPKSTSFSLIASKKKFRLSFTVWPIRALIKWPTG